MGMWELCRCDTNHICPFCKALCVVFIAVLGGVAGFFIKRRLRRHTTKEDDLWKNGN